MIFAVIIWFVVGLLVGVLIGYTVCEEMRHRDVIRRRMQLEERLRRDAEQYATDALMRELGITQADVDQAMKDLAKVEAAE